MKKVMSICLMMIMAVVMSVNAFAAKDNFVSSPSGVPAPGLVSVETNVEGWDGRLEVVPFSEKNSLPEDLKENFEKAYDEIINAENLTAMVPALAEIATKLGIDPRNLAVSDLFDIHMTEGSTPNVPTEFNVVLEAETLKHFVALLHMKQDGTWEVVDNATVVNDGKNLQFTVSDFSPFAVVVDTGNVGQDTPVTGITNSMLYICAGIMAVSAVAVLLIANKRKKQSV